MASMISVMFLVEEVALAWIVPTLQRAAALYAYKNLSDITSAHIQPEPSVQ